MILNIIRPYILSFIPFFVAINVAGILPIFLSLTKDFDRVKKKRVIRNSIITASTIGIGFMFLGKVIFLIMGVSLADFKIGGGILLLVLAIQLLLAREETIKGKIEETAIVPLGTPLITGPAVLTTTVMMIESYGPIPTIVSFVINILLVWFVFLYSEFVIKLIGLNGTKAIAKVVDILLAAIAVMLIREGVVEIIKLSFNL
jgi:multiple antibiotic resistance protein